METVHPPWRWGYPGSWDGADFNIAFPDSFRSSKPSFHSRVYRRKNQVFCTAVQGLVLCFMHQLFARALCLFCKLKIAKIFQGPFADSNFRSFFYKSLSFYTSCPPLTHPPVRRHSRESPSDRHFHVNLHIRWPFILLIRLIFRHLFLFILVLNLIINGLRDAPVYA